MSLAFVALVAFGVFSLALAPACADRVSRGSGQSAPMAAGGFRDDSSDTEGSAGDFGGGPAGPLGVPGAPVAGEASELPRVDCGAPARSSGCVVSGDSRVGVELRGVVLTPDRIFVGGTVVVGSTGRIECVGCGCTSDADALRVECAHGVVSAGLIDAHDHLTYAGTGPIQHGEELYRHRNEWRLGENGHAALSFSGGASALEVLGQELRHVIAGTTSIVGGGGKPGLLRNLDQAHGSERVFPGSIASETFPLGDSAGGGDPGACRFGARPDRATDVAKHTAYLPHLGEGTDERAAAELRCALSPLGLVQSNTAVVHAMAVDEKAILGLVATGASVVWSPRSNLDLYGETAPVRELAAAGVRVALGTDWLASGSMNLSRELACAKHLNETVLGNFFSARDLYRMVTEHAAWAAGVERGLGALVAGREADVVLFTRDEPDPFAAVVDAEPRDVRLVLRGGQPLYGDAALVAAFRDGARCEPLTVCGLERRACVADTGHGLSEILAAAERVYPLAACGVPPSEPRCEVRAHALAPLDGCGDGECVPVQSFDDDLDGVVDGVDDCPRVADPEQQDRDRDGHGDACDACLAWDPGLSPCPTTIAELRSPAHRKALGAPVRIGRARVVAVRTDGSGGFFVEDGDGRDYSGIFAYTGRKTGAPERGSWIALAGYFDRYGETDELREPEFSLISEPPELPTAVAVSASDVGDGGSRAEALASRWVFLEAIVTDTNPDLPKDYDETGLANSPPQSVPPTSTFRLDDALFEALDNDYGVGERLKLWGVAGHSHGHRKLWPIELPERVAD